MTDILQRPKSDTAVSVRLEGINLSFGKTHVLKGIDLQIEPGEFFAFLGPSGCGKTTLLRLIAGFESAQTGRVFIGDKDVSYLPPWQRNLGMVFQSYALWPHMTVRKNVAFGLEERRVPRHEINKRVDKALGLVSLLEFADRRPPQLSGGQQQRVAVARAIVSDPAIVLADEPTANLDSKTGQGLLEMMKQMNTAKQITFIFSTHDRMVMAYARRLVKLRDGRLVDDRRK